MSKPTIDSVLQSKFQKSMLDFEEKLLRGIRVKEQREEMDKLFDRIPIIEAPLPEGVVLLAPKDWYKADGEYDFERMVLGKWVDPEEPK